MAACFGIVLKKLCPVCGQVTRYYYPVTSASRVLILKPVFFRVRGQGSLTGNFKTRTTVVFCPLRVNTVAFQFALLGGSYNREYPQQTEGHSGRCTPS
jgi:hypothetical protein